MPKIIVENTPTTIENQTPGDKILVKKYASTSPSSRLLMQPKHRQSNVSLHRTNSGVKLRNQRNAIGHMISSIDKKIEQINTAQGKKVLNPLKNLLKAAVYKNEKKASQKTLFNHTSSRKSLDAGEILIEKREKKVSPSPVVSVPRI